MARRNGKSKCETEPTFADIVSKLKTAEPAPPSDDEDPPRGLVKVVVFKDIERSRVRRVLALIDDQQFRPSSGAGFLLFARPTKAFWAAYDQLAVIAKITLPPGLTKPEWLRESDKQPAA